ncbi:hypothetical protein Goshw_015391 [Gossypium schwendimanii]|uniref:Uncharacterized protein n=1 Tax=Gossypium schwendimanii TaxID=34291 RepID=A0A7J9LW37_GOSSC|nr:hypothetical protein [Gossypium schwendimanii]
MESKRGGLKKSKVIFMSLYKAPKSSSSIQYGNTSSSAASTIMASATSFYGDAFMDHSTTLKPSIVAFDHTGKNYDYGGIELRNYDEGIDDKAASYISGVRQRLSLERDD